MNRDTIVKLAREAGAVSKDGYQHVLQGDWFIERFAALVAAAEREACAILAACGDDPRAATDPDRYLPGAAQASSKTAGAIAAAIRARGQE